MTAAQSKLIWSGRTTSAGATEALGAVVGQELVVGDIVALVGSLGCGKTQFVRGLAAGMKIDPTRVSSPTFVLVHEYPGGAARPMLVHIDAYRMTGPADLASIGWTPGGGELAEDAVIALEWADRIGTSLGASYLEVKIAHIDHQERRIEVIGHAAWALRATEMRERLSASEYAER